MYGSGALRLPPNASSAPMNTSACAGMDTWGGSGFAPFEGSSSSSNQADMVASAWASPPIMQPQKAFLWRTTEPEESLEPSIRGVPRPPPSAATPSLVIWCEAKPKRTVEDIQAVANVFVNEPWQILQFQTPVQFTRWLFEQPRGNISPWALLMVNWREAKPCAMALAAARNGDVSQLRPDARRPELPMVSGPLPPDRQVGLAVSTMVIMVERPELEARVASWIKGGGNRVSNLDIHVVSDCDVRRTAHSPEDGDGDPRVVSL